MEARDQYGRPQVQIKAERKLDFFFFSSGTFHLSVWSFYKHAVNTAGYKPVILQHKIGQAAAGRSEQHGSAAAVAFSLPLFAPFVALCNADVQTDGRREAAALQK